MKSILVEIEKITTNPNNPRIIRDEKFKALVKSLKEFPKMLEIRPIVVDKDYVCIGGNMRLKAAKEAGLKKINTIIAEDLNDEEIKEFIVKDNVGYGDWDWAKLELDFSDKTLLDWGVELPEFNLDNLDYGVLEGEEEDLEEQLEGMKGSIRKAIQIEFEPEHYDEANELVRWWREQKLYIGGFLMEKLKEEKEKL